MSDPNDIINAGRDRFEAARDYHADRQFPHPYTTLPAPDASKVRAGFSRTLGIICGLRGLEIPETVSLTDVDFLDGYFSGCDGRGKV